MRRHTHTHALADTRSDRAVFEQAAARGTKAGDDNFYGKADLMRPAWAQLQIKLLSVSVSVSVCGNGRWGRGGLRVVVIGGGGRAAPRKIPTTAASPISVKGQEGKRSRSQKLVLLRNLSNENKQQLWRGANGAVIVMFLRR